MRNSELLRRVCAVIVVCILVVQICIIGVNVNADNTPLAGTKTILSGETASWPMDEGAGSFIYDASGHGITGTLSGPAWTSCQVGTALNFDGSNDYVTCGTTITGTVWTALTAQAWIKPETSTGPRYIFYDGSDGEFVIWQNDVHCGITVKLNGVAEKWVTAFNSIEFNKWQMVTGVFTGSELRVYVNGIIRNSTSVPANGLFNPVGNYYPTIGAWCDASSNHNYYFNGAIDAVKVWNEVLSPHNISQEYNASWQNYFDADSTIWINSNWDFNAAHGVTGGAGTQNNPWIIENKNIDGTGFGSCIYIGNTTQHFIVRNCTLQNTSGHSWPAHTDDLCLYLYNNSAGHVDNITFNNCNISICMTKSNHILVANCTSIGNDWGIYVDEDSCNNTLYNNILKNGNDKGITFYQNSNINVACGNLIENFNVVGLYIDTADSNLIFNNTITLCPQYGLDINGGNNNLIYHNNFINNNDDGFVFSGVNNDWDNGYPSGGNYWDDYAGVDLYGTITQNVPPPDGLGDTPFSFSGEQDNYPYMDPNGWFSLPISNSGTGEGIVDDWQYTSPSSFVMDVSPEGEYAVIGDINGNLRLFYEDSNVPLWSLDIGPTIQNVSIAEDGNYIGVIVDNKPRLYSRYGDAVFTGLEMGEIESTIDLTWEGKHAFVGYTNTMNMDLWRMADGMSQTRCQNSNNLPQIPMISGSGDYVATFYNTSPEVPVWNGTSILVPQTTGGWHDPLYTFIDPLGNVNDIALSYDGNTIVAGSSSSDFGIINKTGWFWYASAPSSIIDVDISNDGDKFTALDDIGNLQIVYQNRTLKTISGLFSNAELTGDGNHIICSDVTGSTGLSIYNAALNLVEHNTSIGDYDVGTLFVGNNGHHIWGRTGLIIHHVEAIPHVNLSYTEEYFAAGYDHVNETTLFTISGYSVASNYQIKYELDERGWVEYSGPFNLTGLLPGPHRINYYIVDSEGFETSIIEINIWLDSYGFYSDTEARLTYLETQISNIWAAINSINITTQTLNNSIISIAYNLSQHWNFTGNMSFDVDPLIITNLQDNVTAIWENITNLQTNQTHLWNNITNIIQRIDILELNDTYSNQNITMLNYDLAILEDSLITYYNSLNILSGRVTDMETNGTLTNLQLNQTIWSLSNTTTALHTAEILIQQINEDVATLESEVDTNSDDIDHAESEISMNMMLAIIALILGLVGLLLGLMGLRKPKKPSEELKK